MKRTGMEAVRFSESAIYYGRLSGLLSTAVAAVTADHGGRAVSGVAIVRQTMKTIDTLYQKLNILNVMTAPVLSACGAGALGVAALVSSFFGLTRIVVLSACETAVFHEMKEDNVNQLPSLALSFTWVGIPSVFATLWRVEDKATSILMETFYRNLKNKMGLYESLRVAQTEMIEGGAYTSPYYWASVILFGAWL
jgi:hypothetical protein